MEMRKAGAVVRTVFAVLAVTVTFCAYADRAPGSVKRILLIDSHSSADIWTAMLGEGFRNSLNAKKQKINFENYELGVRYQPGIVPAEADVRALRGKLESVHYDLVVTSNNAAADLFFSERLKLPANTPLLVVPYHGPLPEGIQKRLDVAGVEMPLNLIDNVRLAMQLEPGPRPYAIVAEASADGSRMPTGLLEAEIPAEIMRNIRVLKGTELTTDELYREISALPADAVILFHSWSSSREEDPENSYSVLPHIRKMFPGLILGKFDSYIGHGSAGGLVARGREVGAAAGVIAGRILDGERAADIPFAVAGISPVFDYDALQAAGIDMRKLPAGSTLVNEPPDFIYRHRGGLLAGGGLLLGLLLLSIISQYFRRQAQKKVETLFAHSPLRTIVVGVDGRVLHCHVPEENAGWVPVKFRNMSGLPDPIRESFTAAVADAFGTGRKIELDYEISGRHRHAEFIRLPDDNPFRVRAVMWTSSDVTELHLTHLAVAQTAERFRLTLDSIGDGVIATDAEERITLINPVAAALTGFDAADAVGRKLDEVFRIVSYIDDAPVDSPLRKALAKREIVQLANHTDLISRDGTRRHVADSAAPILDPDGRLAGGVLVFRDVTEDYRKRDELRANGVILKNASKIARFMYFRSDVTGMAVSSSDPGIIFWPTRDGRPVPPEEWISPEDQEEFKAGWRALHSGALTEWQMVYSCGKGAERRYFDIRVEESVDSVNSVSRHREFCGIIQEITHARRDEMHYRDNLKLFETIMDNLPGYIFVKNADDNLRYLMCNRRFSEMTGMPVEKIIGHFDRDVFPLDDEAAEKFRKDDADLVATNGSLDLQEVFRNTAGREFIVRTIKNAIVRSDGTKLLIGMGVDVSRQYELEQEQRNTIDTLNSYINSERIINRSLAGITLEKDFDSAVNNMLAVIGEQSGADRCYVFRYLDEELNRCDNIYEWVRDGIEPQKENLRDATMEMTPHWSQILNSGEDIIIPDIVNPPSGLEMEAEFLAQQSIRSLLVSGIWVDGKLYGFVGIDFVRRRKEFSDCDVHTVRSIVNLYLLARERFLQLERLADSVSLQRQIVDNIAIPIVILDPGFNIVTANPSIQPLAGIPLEEIPGRKCHDIICRHSAPPEWCPMRQTLEDHCMHHAEADYRGRRFAVTSQPIFDRHGKLIYILKSEVDITDLVRQRQELQTAMEQAQAANRAKSFFLATVSHELRTPLNAVIGFSELLRNGVVTPAEQDEYLHSINFAGNALLNLINDVLDLSKLEADQMNMVLAKTDAAQLVRETVSVFKLKAQEKNLALTVECRTRGLVLYLDHLRLRQVILNLVGNAVKFTSEGSVSVEAEFEPDHFGGTGTFTIRVADTGIGISPENVRKVFDPFVQDESTRGTHIYEGSGLGLAISQRLVAKMGGSIGLESTPGAGSVFSVRLPGIRCEAETAAASEAPAPVAATGETVCRALLVDDVPLNLKVLQAMLRKLDIECISVSSGAEALECLRTGTRVEVILTDLWMPDMNGVELARRLAQNPETSWIPVVAVTADTQVVADSENIFADVILKPVTLEALRKVVGGVLAGRGVMQ
ncbi:MAG: PAS domain-containing protein [Lentisphaeria bacterium]|nr:PAS domain-containing protein [Lentisphaeria bacterium]